MILGGLAVLGIAVGLVLYALRDTIVFFYTPSEIAEKNVAAGPRVCAWAAWSKKAVRQTRATATYSFIVTDKINTMKVTL